MPAEPSYEDETSRIMQLGQFLAAFSPKAGEEMRYGAAADDLIEPAILEARDAAILDSFLAVGRIARTSFVPAPTPPPADPAPAGKAGARAGSGAARSKVKATK